jgi:hypothetical protein
VKTPISLCSSVKRSVIVLSVLLVACGGGGGAPSLSVVAPDPFHGIAVPPEPDAVANSTLLGVDSNNNMVRDDVERLIAMAYGSNAAQYDGALRIAKADQDFLVANGDPAKSTSATMAAATAGFCLYSRLANDGIAANKAIDSISPLTFNTPERMIAYRATSLASTEVSTPVPVIPCL